MTTTQPVSREGFTALVPTLPSGRAAPAVPAAARALVDRARAAGWFTLVQWAEATDDSPFLDVQLGIRHPSYRFQLCWHSFGQSERESWPYRTDVAAARLRLFSKLACTDGPWREASSLKRIHQIIDQHPQLPPERRRVW
ncbi:hypothetical protein [Parasphingorhabdus pacifica]